jgi:hypothetical protein
MACGISKVTLTATIAFLWMSIKIRSQSICCWCGLFLICLWLLGSQITLASREQTQLVDLFRGFFQKLCNASKAKAFYPK